MGGYNITTIGYQRLQKALEAVIEERLEQYDVVWGHSGLALGADTIWSKAILAMKQKYPNRVFFHAELPNLNQSNVWFKASDIDFWKEQLENADATTNYDPTYLDWLKTNPTDNDARNRVRKSLLTRNIGMIDHSDEMIAIYNGTITKFTPSKPREKGGTAHAIHETQRVNKKITHINPIVFF